MACTPALPRLKTLFLSVDVFPLDFKSCLNSPLLGIAILIVKNNNQSVANQGERFLTVTYHPIISSHRAPEQLSDLSKKLKVNARRVRRVTRLGQMTAKVVFTPCRKNFPEALSSQLSLLFATTTGIKYEGRTRDAPVREKKTKDSGKNRFSSPQIVDFRLNCA